MANADRRTIEELVTRYELEPSLKDIYVEGAEDKRIVDAMLEEHRISGVSVFEVSSVDVPTDPHEETGNRTKLMRLARALLEAFRDGQLRLVCIIDSDFDHLSGNEEQNAFLLKTDYANMEMYFFSPAVIDKMNRHCLRSPRLTDRIRQRFMVPTLQFLFRVRYVSARPKWKLKESPFEKLVSLAEGHFAFDKHEYIRRYLNKNSRYAERSEFQSEVEGVGIPPQLDARCFMHGHDSLALLRKMLNCLGDRRVSKDVDALFSTLRGCADYTALAQEPMFAAILQRFG